MFGVVCPAKPDEESVGVHPGGIPASMVGEKVTVIDPSEAVVPERLPVEAQSGRVLVSLRSSRQLPANPSLLSTVTSQVMVQSPPLPTGLPEDVMLPYTPVQRPAIGV